MANEQPTEQTIHFWEIMFNDCGALLGISTRAIIEDTIRKLKRLEDLEKKQGE